MRLPVDGRRVKGFRPASIANVRSRLAGERLEVAAVAIRLAHALGVFVELGGVEGASKEVLEDDRVRNADRLQVPHRRRAVCGR